MLRTLVICLSVFVCTLAGASPASGASPADAINTLHGTLLDNMKNGPKLGCSGRIARLTPAIDATFDLPFLAQRVLRRQWKDLPEDQRKKFLETFRELVIGTYASQFSKFNGESFTTLDTQTLADGTKLVHAELAVSKSETVKFDYVVHEVAGAWRIVNVVADGVSDLAIRSAQYDKAFKAGGFDGLMKTLNLQIASNKTDC